MRHYHRRRSCLTLSLSRNVACRYGRMSDRSMIVVHRRSLVHRKRMNRCALSYRTRLLRSLITRSVHRARATGNVRCASSVAWISWRRHLSEKTVVTGTGNRRTVRNRAALVSRRAYGAQFRGQFRMRRWHGDFVHFRCERCLWPWRRSVNQWTLRASTLLRMSVRMVVSTWRWFWPIKGNRWWLMKRLQGMIIFLLLPWFLNTQVEGAFCLSMRLLNLHHDQPFLWYQVRGGGLTARRRWRTGGDCCLHLAKLLRTRCRPMYVMGTRHH